MMAHKLVALFLRHGSTELNDHNQFRGPLNVDLDDKGRKEAKQAAEHLKGRVSEPVLVSSKKRTKQTADIVAKGKKQKVIKNFDPLNVGDFAGKDKTDENIEAIRHYQDNPEEKIPGGERLRDFRNRVNPKIQMAIRRGEESGKPSLSVVHSSIIHQIGDLLHGDHEAVKVRPGGIVGVYKTPNGYVAKALLKKSYDEQDKHLTS